MKALKVNHITKQFGSLAAVKDVSFDVEQGELVGVIGPNGSGKTTMISLISGTQTLTSGSIEFGEHDLSRLPAYRRARLGIARTFQIVRPLQNLSVRDNIMTAALFGCNALSVPREVSVCLSDKYAKRAYEESNHIAALVGLEEKNDVFARNLTLPDRKKLEVGRALAMKPKLLLLDEVMAGLNLKEVDEVIQLIRNVHESGVTIIMIEHIMKVIMGLSQRVIVMDQGKLIAQGLPQDVAQDPVVIEAYLGKRKVEV